jgi:hypothetical protein
VSNALVSSSAYDFYSQFLEIAANYFTLTDTSTLKVGMFGYTTDVFAHIAKDATFHRNFLYNEYFINSAALHTSVYNWAKILEEPVNLAQPAKLQAVFTVDTIAAEAAAQTSNAQFSLDGTTIITQPTIRTLTIDRKTPFIVGNYKFLLPHDIDIIFNRTSGANDAAITAVYDTSSANYIDSSIVSPYLKTSINLVNGSAQLSILINLYQLEYKEFNFNVLSDDILDRSIYEVDYSGSLASFNIFYNPNNSVSTSYTGLVPVFNDNVVDTTVSNYALYTPISDTQLRIYFSNKPNFFKPDFNSKLRIETFITLGDSGNFTYNGGITMNNTSLASLKYTIVSLTDSIGGTAVDTLTTMKTKLINKLRTRNSITTSDDLNALFTTIEATTSINNSLLSVVKTRDDFLSRQFSVYTLLRDANGGVVPSNTINMSMSIADVEAIGYVIKPGSLIIYDRTTSKYRFLDVTEIPDYYLNNSDSYIFSVPFLFNLDFKEFPKLNAYHTNYDKSYILDYEYININAPYQIVINDLGISRNSLIDIDKFRVNCFLNSSIINQSSLVLALAVYQGGSIIAIQPMTRNGTTTEFYFDINTLDTFDSQGRYLVSFDGVTNVATYEELEFKIGVFYSASTLTSDSTSAAPDLIAWGKSYASGNNPSSQVIDNFTIAAVLSPSIAVPIADDLSDIIHCPIKIDTGTGIVNITRLPVISAGFFLNNKLSNDVSTTLYNLINSLRASSLQLENNTALDVKFFNTCGLSQLFSSDTIDLSIQLQMSLNVLSSPRLDKKIKTFIVNFIENVNSKSEQRFSLSNLTTALETNFKEINFIKFVSINGANLQNVYYSSGLVSPYPKTYVPEFLTVKKKNGTDIDNSEYIFDIDINYI